MRPKPPLPLSTQDSALLLLYSLLSKGFKTGGGMFRRILSIAILVLVSAVAPTSAQNKLVPAQGDFTIRDFKFDSGEQLPELKLHYRTFGTPKRDTSGMVINAVLIMHGTGGSGGAFVSDSFAGVL